MKVCNVCNIEKPYTEFHKHGLNRSGSIRYKPCCKDCRSNDNKEKEYKRIYRENNKDNIREYNRKYEKNRKEYDELFKFKRSVRSLICRSFKYVGKKSSKTTDMIGCSIEELKKHIESLFLDGMNWDNRHLWHIDHIKPLSTAKTIDDVYILNHYTNLRPLWAVDNLNKRFTDKKMWCI